MENAKVLLLLFIYFYYKFLMSRCDRWLSVSKKVMLISYQKEKEKKVTC